MNSVLSGMPSALVNITSYVRRIALDTNMASLANTSTSTTHGESRLLALPDELLGAVLRAAVGQGDSSSNHAFMASKRLAACMLRHARNIHLTYPAAHGYDYEQQHPPPLATFLTDALRARQAELTLTLGPDDNCMWYFEDKPVTDAVARLAVVSLGAVGLCRAATHLCVRLNPMFGQFWEPVYTAALCASFPALTSLTLQHLDITPRQLRLLLRHPLMLPMLQRLDVSLCWIEQQGGGGRGGGGDRPVPGGAAAARGAQLDAHWMRPCQASLLGPAISSLTALHTLSVVMTCLQPVGPLLMVLPSMPTLRSLTLGQGRVRGDDEVLALLAATQITELSLDGFGNLMTDHGTSPCSWRRLQLHADVPEWATVASLPLHALSHPLSLSCLGAPAAVEVETLVRAEHNLCQRNTAGVKVEAVVLDAAGVALLTDLFHSAVGGGVIPMKRLGACVANVNIVSTGGGMYCSVLRSWVHLSLPPSSLHALSALFPNAHLNLCQPM
ncbi:hypothetical protein QJQ45_017937 [Haematococcus lacustris]|nr:hypothetical protein QJQ45_017937 [Haematococcus lacustris]